MFRIITVIFIVTLFSCNVMAQSNSQNSIPVNRDTAIVKTRDTTSFFYAFKSGKVSIHFRYFFMSTQNERGLTDYYANALGGGIRYETAPFHHFQFAISGFTIFNIGSSDLAAPDPLTGQYNRYEAGLFDITDLSKKAGINSVGELYLKYNFKKSFVRIGRQVINSAFINLQDGRMRPTWVAGAWAEIKEIKNLKIQGGWLWAISPRSTADWYNTGKSIGLYPVGVTPEGAKSGYANNTESSGIALLQADWDLEKNFTVQAWNMLVDNVFNTSMVQADKTFPLANDAELLAGVQAIRQIAIHDGGNFIQSKSYFTKSNQAQTYGVRAGWKNKRWETTINYNRITAKGRYLSPREWGFDPFFTFLPREKNDGLGDVQAVTGKVSYSCINKGLKASLAGGYYHLPDVKNYVLNKYGFPSYTQVNADIRYTFMHTLKGLEAEFLFVDKINEGNTYDNFKFIFDKVNMLQYNFIVNFYF
jgi:hypothetical protein